jgi:hypothetical protein
VNTKLINHGISDANYVGVMKLIDLLAEESGIHRNTQLR